MNTDLITTKAVKIAVDKLGLEETEVRENLDNPLSGALGVDSLDFVELLMELESEFNISIPDEEADNCRTLNDFVNVVEKKINV